VDVFQHFDKVIAEAVSQLVAAGELPAATDISRISVEPPRDAAHGDIASNAAMVLARSAGIPPRRLAEKLKAIISGHDAVSEVEIAGPGFINLRLKPEFWPRIVTAVLEQAEDFGRCDLGRGIKVNVEYVSANPTGPLHIGHGRGAVFGDALANLLEFTGYDVTREYYINDAGGQVDQLARSVHLRYREALGEDIGEIPSGLYPGDYLVPVGRDLASRHGSALREMAEEEWLPIVRDFAVEAMLDLIKDDLAQLGIHHEVFTSERSLHGEGGEIDTAIAALRERGLVYEGRLPPPKGQLPDDWEDREQTLFRATAFGDDTDRPLIKSDGTYTYFAADVAYFHHKFRRGFQQMIYVLGADHGGYVKRLEAIGQAIAGDSAQVIAKLCQLVRLFRGGEPVRMSKRAGDFVTLREVVDEVGPDVVRFIMLFRKNDAPLDFDLKKVTEQSRENPVFYVQYAHARICSVIRNAQETLPESILDEDAVEPRLLERLTDELELQLIKRLADYPRTLRGAAEAHEPHRLAFFLYELSSTFHALWTRGKELPHLRFINAEDMDATVARLALLRAVRYVLANGLGILGVVPVHEMR